MEKFDCTFIGDVNPDLVILTDGQMPVLGREVMCDAFYMTLGGSTGICAGVFGSLGGSARVIGRVGGDDLGRFAIEKLVKCGVDVGGVSVEADSSTSVTVAFTTPQDRALVSYDGNHRRIREADLPANFLGTTRHIHVASFFFQRQLQPMYLKLFKAAREQGVTVSLDAGWDITENWDHGILELLDWVDIFFPNESEAVAITGQSEVAGAAAALAGHCRIAVVKTGKAGSILKTGAEPLLHCPIYDRYVGKDFTGAGDSYNAGFLHAYLGGKTLPDCMRYGSATAALRVSGDRRAHEFATLAEVERIVREEPSEVSA